jgi:KUP system potassium uptake protein
MSDASEESRSPDGERQKTGRSVLVLAALGIVFGDIGTSPLYALRECFVSGGGIPLCRENVLGSVSLIFWFLVIIVSIKYVLFVMRADNKGEGGILALMALVHRIGPVRVKNLPLLSLLGVVGAALLFSDGAITPAISVLSAIEGLNVATPLFSPFVIPLSIAVLIGLFVLQSHGSGKIGALFGPVMVVWFLLIGFLGAMSVARCPAVLAALNPVYAVHLLLSVGWKSFGLLGAAFLAVTGAEMLYADMGHFGRVPIREGWFFIVFPSLVLNYLGQGSCLLLRGSPENLFYQLAPSWFLYPMVVISTLATVIASQAVISGAFSLARQSVQLGFWPRMKIIHTSKNLIGQVYIPFVNGALFIAVILLILGFKASDSLGAAYGIAVSATMFITTSMVLLLARRLWRAPLLVTIPVGLFFLLFDLAVFAANLSKVLSGGWVVIFIAVAVCILMTTWIKGRKILHKQVTADAIPLEMFAKELAGQSDLTRTNRTGVFLSGNTNMVPRALLHNYKHNGVLHVQTFIVTVQTGETPHVPASDRVLLSSVGQGIYKVTFRYGFMESPDVPTLLAGIKIPGASTDPGLFSYFLGKESLVPAHRGAMAPWRKQIFMFLSKNSLDASSFFKLPPNRVVELGAQVEF